MSGFDSILAGMQPDGEGWSAHGPENWLQGRTLYGGLSAALALNACALAVPGLPPLRAGQVAYISPASQDVRLVPTLLRQGKSVTYMACDLISEGRIAVRALFAFGGARESAYAAEAPPPPQCLAPDASRSMRGSGRPAYTWNIDQRLAGELAPLAGADRGDLLVWVRHSDPVAPGMAALLVLGDALPPASFTRFTQPAVISTMTWSFELFDPGHADGTGWYLLRSTDDGLGEGYAGQAMAMWDETGRPVMLGRQAVAVFG
ncbi:thioesterase family protein [Sandaracinobacter sp. RS1-74]|uniref:acyl-CoA thioesterase n=1 Tax=Sandaracinobacteroides sayramensis TaxID=2913411 RepID=UPI001EDC5E0E|nr:thioesterase family protein [Sandaracinobacteroides sayramensis]MCG2841069.1 thioesterase family protein [Sandaracinobacteroides sayramensis]